MTPLPIVRLLVLFGSHATGTTGAMSDFDVAVLSDHELSFEERNALIDDISITYKISEEKVDLIDLRSAPPLLERQIAEHGKLLKGNPLDFIRFRVLAWKRYQDTAKFRRARAEKLANTYGN